MSTDRIVAITGAGGALGSALAEHLVARGYRAALFDTERSHARLETLVGALGGSPKAVFHAGDFARADVWTEALGVVRRAFGHAPTHAALVAGGWDGGRALHASDDDAAYGAMMSRNVDTAHRAFRALLPAMVEARSGSVVVVGSRAVARPWTSTGASAYAASKAAVVTMAEVVAAEVLEHGVRVNAILPSTLDTPANRAAMPDVDPSTWVSLASASAVVAFLLSDEARDVSGAALPVYGRA